MQDVEGASAVFCAARGNHLSCLDLLLEHGCSPDAATREGETAVMTTARFESHLPCAEVSSTPCGYVLLP